MSLIDKYGSEHQKRVAAFMRGAGQAVPDTVTMPTLEERQRHGKMLVEEMLETLAGLGLSLFIEGDDAEARALSKHDFRYRECVASMEEIIDGATDVKVIATGILNMCGLPDTPFIEEVDRSNLAKLDGGWTDENGKFRKPANWTPPDIAGVLHRIQQGDA